MAKKRVRNSSKKLTSTKLLFLSVILLFIVFEALYILKVNYQQAIQAGILEKKVAGVSTD